MLTDKQTLILTAIIALGFSVTGIFGILDNYAIIITLIILIIIFLINFYFTLKKPNEEEEDTSL